MFIVRDPYSYVRTISNGQPPRQAYIDPASLRVPAGQRLWDSGWAGTYINPGWLCRLPQSVGRPAALGGQGRALTPAGCAASLRVSDGQRLWVGRDVH